MAPRKQTVTATIDDEAEVVSNGRVSPTDLVRKDLRAMASTLGIKEIRYLVDLYYQMQDYREGAASQARILAKEEEPNLVLLWATGTMRATEDTIKSVMDRWTQIEPTGMGMWAREIVGIGPVLSAGLLAHIDIAKVQTAGQIWRFAGLDPTDKWNKGEKRPWNADLKVLCWKLGESFVKVSNHPNDVYGKVYAARKALEQERNLRGEYKAQAEEAVKRLRRDDTTAKKWYSGQETGTPALPPGHIHARAKRYAVKLFLAHWFEEAYARHYKTPPPLPYPIAHLGHAHVIERPNPTRV